ncbi:hypothetical protein ODS41_05945 [Pyrobaculum sp. 3827-6]|jgi:hypothetical protein|uniref:hypothetical protein n=1 Tax=Pyrobaculum sp. 3827-6 TaxID=2983604 RepID=UPI0021D8F025|nr:hypothetical protein [Pyrobaculum sp. 3827-6]MCU7787461.1 hypothetical protein [Pyrobaculum sp. 3827-6]
MQKVVRGRSYVFEGELAGDVVTLLEKWGTVKRSGEVVIFSIDSGEIKIRKVSESPSAVVRRIYISPSCGCLLELDETRNFEEGRVFYSLHKLRLCQEHQA